MEVKNPSERPRPIVRGYAQLSFCQSRQVACLHLTLYCIGGSIDGGCRDHTQIQNRATKGGDGGGKGFLN